MKTKLITLALITTACAPIPLVQPTPVQPQQQQYYQQGAPPPASAPVQQQYAPAGAPVAPVANMEQGLNPHTAIPVQIGSAIEGIFQDNKPPQRYYSLPVKGGQMLRFTSNMTITSSYCYVYLKISNSQSQKIDRKGFDTREPGQYWEFRAPYDDTYQLELDPSCGGKTVTYNVAIQGN